MANAVPRSITRSDPSQVSIEWDDGSTSRFTARELRQMCPCARCIDELTGALILNREAVPEDLTQTNLRLVGNYAITLSFSDGHDTGIYPFTMLRARAADEGHAG